MDSVSVERRSEIMARVRGKDTRPEMTVRRLVHAMGYRYALHSRDLPGRPDLVFRPRSRAIFVHGCFWHRHSGCALARMPKSRLAFWRDKLDGNRARDQRNKRALRTKGWHVLTVWECDLANADTLARRLKRFLGA